MVSAFRNEYTRVCQRWFFEQDEDARAAIEAVKRADAWVEPLSATAVASLTRMGLKAPWCVADEILILAYEIHKKVRSEFHAAAAENKRAAFRACVDNLVALRLSGADDENPFSGVAGSYGSTAEGSDADGDIEAGGAAAQRCSNALPPLAEQKAAVRVFARNHGAVYGAGPFFHGLRALLTAQLADARCAAQWRLLDIVFTEMGGSDAFAADGAALMVSVLGCSVERLSTPVSAAASDGGDGAPPHAPIAESVWTLSPALSDRRVRALLALLPRAAALSGRATGAVAASAVARRVAPRERTSCC